MMRCVWIALLVLAGCGSKDPGAPSDDPAPQTAASVATEPALPCETDKDCVGDWSPQQRGCGSNQRCMEGLCVAPPAITGTANLETGRLVFEGTPEHSFHIEIADAPFETTRGLMCRESMQADWGMLFFMRNVRPQRFWMFNTLISLDMVFLDEEWTVVGVVPRTEPLSMASRGVDTPSKYVLELGAGVAEKNGIETGRKARFYAPQGTP